MSSLCIKANLPTALPADNNLTLHGFGNVHTLSHANAHRSANPLERCRSIPNRTRPVDNRQATCPRESSGRFRTLPATKTIRDALYELRTLDPGVVRFINWLATVRGRQLALEVSSPALIKLMEGK